MIENRKAAGDSSLTAETVQRAAEGLAAARSQAVQRSLQAAATDLEQLGKGEGARGGWRRCAVHWLVRSLFRVRVEHPERIPLAPTILAANHLNHIDPFLLLSEVPASPYYYILGDARTLFNKCWKRSILRVSGGVIPLARRWREELAVIEAARAGRRELLDLARGIEGEVPAGNDISTLRAIDRAIQAIFARGDGIILFPEGRLGREEGTLATPLQRGVALYALRSGVPILPAALIGTQNLYLGKELTLRFGEPLAVEQCRRPRRGEVEAVLKRLEEAMGHLLPRDYRDSEGPKLFSYFLNHLFD